MQSQRLGAKAGHDQIFGRHRLFSADGLDPLLAGITKQQKYK